MDESKTISLHFAIPADVDLDSADLLQMRTLLLDALSMFQAQRQGNLGDDKRLIEALLTEN